eukprot:m.8170 g.8170  ORF g.8170 m.8170 type:complete len:532 (-) comp5327_c0_seq2:269-1864(-)
MIMWFYQHLRAVSHYNIHHSCGWGVTLTNSLRIGRATCYVGCCRSLPRDQIGVTCCTREARYLWGAQQNLAISHPQAFHLSTAHPLLKRTKKGKRLGKVGQINHIIEAMAEATGAKGAKGTQPVFHKYPKIYNIDAKWMVAHADREVVATEKVHGSNFQIVVSETGELMPARRNGYLKDGENFFNCRKVLAKYKENLVQLAQLAREQRDVYLAEHEATVQQQTVPVAESSTGSDAVAEFVPQKATATAATYGDDEEEEDHEESLVAVEEQQRAEEGVPHVVRVYGELFGGEFYGTSTSTQVQKNVNYHPDVELMVFDIAVGTTWLPFDVVVSACKKVGLNTCPVVARGVFKDIKPTLNPATMTTAVPSVYGLEVPAHAKAAQSNACIAEGLVLRHTKPSKPTVRGGIMKWKHPEFEEVCQGVGRPQKTKKAAVDPEIASAAEGLACYLNEQRADSYISKEGLDGASASGKYFGKMIQAVLADAVEDYLGQLEPEDPTHKIFADKATKKKVTSMVMKRCVSVCRTALAGFKL